LFLRLKTNKQTNIQKNQTNKTTQLSCKKLAKTFKIGSDCPFVKSTAFRSLFVFLLFYVPLKNISLNGDVTIAGEGLKNLGLCSALRAFEQGGIFIVPHLL
jgi:hypothetical protein